MNYRIYFEGYIEVEAEDMDEAEERFWNEDYDYKSYEVVDVEEIDEADGLELI